MTDCILQNTNSEMALLRRHPSEDIFGVQVLKNDRIFQYSSQDRSSHQKVCGKGAEQMIKCADLMNRELSVDFIDLNVGCPIDLVFNRGCGSGLMKSSRRLEAVVRGMTMVRTSKVDFACFALTRKDLRHSCLRQDSYRYRQQEECGPYLYPKDQVVGCVALHYAWTFSAAAIHQAGRLGLHS